MANIDPRRDAIKQVHEGAQKAGYRKDQYTIYEEKALSEANGAWFRAVAIENGTGNVIAASDLYRAIVTSATTLPRRSHLRAVA